MRVVDLRRQRVALGGECVALVAQLLEFRVQRLRFIAQLRDLLLEREPFRLMALIQRDQAADVLR